MRKVKKKVGENLSPQNIEKVKTLLKLSTSDLDGSSGKAITKKEACDILNISYNTTRLTKIIEEHDEQKAYVKTRKAALRGRLATDAEISEACTCFLEGDTVTDISKRLFRSAGFVRTILEKVGVPQRPNNKEDRLMPNYFPDECVAEDFAHGEIAWSATYHSTVVVKEQLNMKWLESRKGMSNTDYEAKYGCPCYSIYVVQKSDAEEDYFSNVTEGGFNAYAPAYELGKLQHLKQYGVNLEKL